MAVVDGYVPATALTFHRGHQTLTVPDLHGLGVKTQIDFFADQPRAHRVGVVRRADGRKMSHPHALAAEVLDPHRRKLFHSPSIVANIGPPLVACREDLAQERLVGRTIRKVARPADEQSLLHCKLEAVMSLFDRSVLVCPSRRVAIRFYAVMGHRTEVAFVERPASVAQVVRRG